MAKNGRFWWDINAIFYDVLMSKLHRHLYKDIIKALGPLDNVKIDDVGCGTGELILLMPKTAIIRGIDYSKKAINKCRKKCAKHNAKFYVMDFYKELPKDYKPDKVVACRSLYHKNLDLSLSTLSKHLGKHGLVVVAHPKLKWQEYVSANAKSGFIRFMQITKSSARVFSKLLGYPYNLFPLKDFKKYGKKYFDKVECREAGLKTHYLIILKKGVCKEIIKLSKKQII
ncbi:hypothetical protein AYK26_04405 [Euryarchaeota archaeon SM23-78]|nr:MAG: hypothetical protein AYK26_04405 [Euryarchaeota archaeon SM23-78]MBW3000738.1 class I SAM-dependent methyltransferase [Candidatus Woesearchaeota archaeon]